MISEKIEKIKSEYTDKYVVVHTEQPELARFRDYVGQVKTVNMSGRALVEFEAYNQNIGWYDIELDYLKVVDKPSAEKPQAKAGKKAAVGTSPAKGKPAVKSKPAGKGAKKSPVSLGDKKLSPLELARQQGAAKGSSGAEPSADGSSADGGQAPVGKKTSDKSATGKRSTADILAAARGGPAKERSAKESSPVEVSKPTGASPAKGAKLSTADILAAARGGSAKSSKVEEPAEEITPSEEKSAPVATGAKVAESAAPSGAVDKSNMTIDEMCAWCREHDAG